MESGTGSTRPLPSHWVVILQMNNTMGMVRRPPVRIMPGMLSHNVGYGIGVQKGRCVHLFGCWDWGRGAFTTIMVCTLTAGVQLKCGRK